MNDYPRDEFDAVPENARREGSHRSFSRVRDPRKGIWPLVICGVLALVVGLVMFTVVKPWATGQSSTDAGSASTASPSASASATSSATGTASEGAASTQASSTESAESSSTAQSTEGTQSTQSTATATAPSTSTSSDALSGLDATALATRVGVYNGTSSSGLATEGATTLKSAGFTSVVSGNWTKKTTSSAVYFKSLSSQATAQAIAAKLGIDGVYQTSNIPTEISVVYGSDALTR